MEKIYVVEDDRNIQEIEVYALNNSGFEVKGFDTAKAFFEALEEEVPALVLLDIMLPDEDGLTVLHKIRSGKDTQRLPVIMVTAKTTELDKVKGLDNGADDYITKPFGIMELISRVKALLRRSEGQKTESLLRIGEIVLDERKRSVTSAGNVCELTYKEYELLLFLMKNASNVVTREMILNRVWGTDFEGESRTLDMHIKTLRQKLGSQGSLIKTVRNVGYIIG